MKYSKNGVSLKAADRWVEWIQKLGNQKSSRTQKYAPDRALKNARQEKQLKSGIGDYAAVYAATAEFWLALSCDGVGTKLLWTLEGLGDPRHLAQDLLAMNANDVLCVGAKPTLFLDYLAVGSRDLLKKGSLLSHFLEGLHEVCLASGQLLVGGETAQLPDLYAGTHFDLAGFSVGFLSPREHLSIDRAQAGSVLWAWPSSGPHSNGFSWLRKIFSPRSKKDAAFIKKHLMPPTRLYISEMGQLKALLKSEKAEDALQTAFHITGSGFLNFIRSQPKNAKRFIGFEMDWSRDRWPAWLNEVEARSGASPRDLLSTFNAGLGFAVLIDKRTSQRLEKKLRQLLGLEPVGVAIPRNCLRIAELELS